VPLGVCDVSANVTYVIHVMALLQGPGRYDVIYTYCAIVQLCAEDTAFAATDAHEDILKIESLE
jgi:hypothetical protein